MSKIIINKVYEFEIENFQFGDLSRDECIECFKDGRVNSHFAERQLTKWFPSLTHIQGCKDHDHIDTDGVCYDAKSFTKNGLDFKPSNQKGSGRKFNESVAHAKAADMIYICCDILDFPKMKVKFVKGSELIKTYPKCSVTLSMRNKFFKQIS
jgi:hypothetical protein